MEDILIDVPLAGKHLSQMIARCIEGDVVGDVFARCAHAVRGFAEIAHHTTYVRCAVPSHSAAANKLAKDTDCAKMITDAIQTAA